MSVRKDQGRGTPQILVQGVFRRALDLNRQQLVRPVEGGSTKGTVRDSV